MGDQCELILRDGSAFPLGSDHGAEGPGDLRLKRS